MRRAGSPVYLDNNATAPLDPRALDEMLPYLRGEFGNPASASHAYGWTAEAAVEVARERVAEAVGAAPDEVCFTSGATEADNLALRGTLFAGAHLVTCATEHEAVLHTARTLEGYGVSLTVLPVDENGCVSPEKLRKSLRNDTALVSVMLANNETGVVQDIASLAAVAAERGVPFHTDAAQALGRLPLDASTTGLSMMSLSAHKAGGPKGVGALVVRRVPGLPRLAPLLTGGGQENGLRGGTLNVPGIVGFGKAAEIAAESLPEETERLRSLKLRLLEALTDGLSGPGVEVLANGDPSVTLPNTLSVRFGGLDAGKLLANCPQVAASTGSACASRDPEPSHVLAAMGLDEKETSSTVRLSLGRFTTEGDVEAAAEHLVQAAREVRQTNFR
ncbi:cysteine desulfurase family protein [Rubrobacter indicoceani]|uniref:cysteine desulfurase family protein n=1 Tax=Rubrobacter indicoceani TaxID=2051957 RepID=UPI000E5A4BA6|nr:cysteine desulfurase family protein [Rubrobacter indicoceani]